MRDSFKDNVHTYNDVIKNKKISPNNKADKEIKIAANRRETTIGVQKNIFSIQEKKQEIMEKLQEKMRCIDDPGCKIEHDPGTVKVSQDSNGIFIIRMDGSRTDVTLGDIITNIEWDVRYYFDDSVARVIKKQYILADAKKELQEYLDEQILIDEIGSRKVDRLSKMAYTKLVEAQDRKNENGIEQGGFMAERIVKNYLKKLAIDFDLPFSVLDGDPYEDVLHKADFIIHSKVHRRGVGVEASDEIKDVAVQFTGNTSGEVIGRKKKQIHRVKSINGIQNQFTDIILVVVPLGKILRAHDDWERKDGIANSVDSFLDGETKKKIFFLSLKGMYSDIEITDMWDRVRK